ncbi:MAG TPA: hypothetical protein ENH15_05020, partial [Actinobacteria bacterium]|nr:hypothetical protein [Actinomycetota bacterium]
MTKGGKVIAMTVGVAVLAAAVGWFGASRLQSREEAQAESQPPEPSLITVEVQRVELSNTVVVRGTVRFSDSTDISVVANYEGVSILTGVLADQGTLIEDGQAVAEVGGRPVFVLQGELPAFRDLGPGQSGDDVEQLEEALARLGFDPGPVDGIYDAATAAAVTALYDENGYAPQPRSAQERAQIDGAEAAVEGARDQLRSAEQGLAAARRPLPESQQLALDQQVADAERALEEAEDLATEQIASAVTLAADLEAAKLEATATTEAATIAADRLAEAEAGTHPDTGVAPTPEELADLQAAATEAEDAKVSALAAVEDAQAALDALPSDPNQGVEDAKFALAIAQATRTEALTAPDTTFESRAEADAHEFLEDAIAELEELELEFGVRFPSSEIIYLDTLPRRVDAVLADRGDDITSGVMYQVSGADVVIDSGISAVDRSLVNVGDRAIAEDDGLGVSFETLIIRVNDNPGGPDAADDRYYVQFEPVDDPG